MFDWWEQLQHFYFMFTSLKDYFNFLNETFTEDLRFFGEDVYKMFLVSGKLDSSLEFMLLILNIVVRLTWKHGNLMASQSDHTFGIERVCMGLIELCNVRGWSASRRRGFSLNARYRKSLNWNYNEIAFKLLNHLGQFFHRKGIQSVSFPWLLLHDEQSSTESSLPERNAIRFVQLRPKHLLDFWLSDGRIELSNTWQADADWTWNVLG